jgi:hypothetical protein
MNLVTFTKLIPKERSAMDHQSLLLSLESLLDVNPLKNFKTLFSNLDASHLDSHPSTGRKPIPRESLLRAIIFKNLKAIPTLTELVTELKDNPSAAIRCGFNILRPLPSVERFSSFLKNTHNKELQKTRLQLIHNLIDLAVITGEYLSIDSCPIPARVKENNLKTNVKNRFSKFHIPKGSPDARLGIMVIFPKPNQKQIRYFWGFRDHVVIDAKEELPIWHITKPANVHESVMFCPIFKLIQNEFHFSVKAVIGDAAYDTNSILKYVVKDLKAKPRISRNPRNTQNPPNIQFSKSGNPICQAQLEMINYGSFYDKKQNRCRRKWVCPLHYSKKIARQYLLCPAFHPKFFSQKGCYVYIRIDQDIRSEIDYGSSSFKTDAKLRSGSERVFSRLLNICMQNPPVISINAVSNYVTIAHITVLLVALTAAKNSMKDKVRFIKSFLPRFCP